MSYAPNSPDLNPEVRRLSYLIRNMSTSLPDKTARTKELNQRMLVMRHGLKQSVIDDAFGHQLRVMDDAQLTSVINIPVHVFE